MYDNSAEVYTKIQQKTNKKTLQRFDLLDKLLIESQKKNFLQKLNMANKFVNQVNYLLDQYHWRKEDYWATPYEFISTGAGDSEDFALMKYYVLMLMGIDEKKLKLMSYQKENKQTVKYKTKTVVDPQYIVLAYFHNEDSVPLIFDTVHKKIYKEPNAVYLKELMRSKNKTFDELYR